MSEQQEELIELSHPNTGKSIFVNLKSNACYTEFPSSAKLYDCLLTMRPCCLSDTISYSLSTSLSLQGRKE